MTIKEIAKLAGVSISTVSKIVNGKDEHINPQTRSKVLKIVKENHFTPYGSVKTAASSKHFLIGVLLRSASLSALTLSGILHTAQEHGYGIVLLESGGDSALESRLLASLSQIPVDGILLEPGTEGLEERLLSLHRGRIPFCLLDHPSPSSFRIDFEAFGYSLARMLTEKNHQSLACFPGKEPPFSLDFLKGFQKCLYEYHLPFREELVFSGVEDSFLQKFIQYGLTGAVCADLADACALHELMLRQHYQIPGDLSLVSLSGQDQKVPLASSLSRVQIPYEEFGSYVCRQLIQRVEKSAPKEASARFFLDVPLCHEKSIGPPSFLQKKSFICVGSIHKDLTFNVSALPQPGNTLKIQNASLALGGKGANQAVGIARLGHPVYLIGAVGNDFDASFILDSLEKERISTLGISRNRRKMTGKAYIYTETEGESAVTILSGANDGLNAKDIKDNQALFSNACFCLISGEIPMDAVIEAARIAKANQVTTVFKPSALSSLPPELYSTIDILVPNQKEADALYPGISSVEEQAEYFFQKGIPTVIVTLGHDGCYLKTRTEACFFPAFHLETVDTTGGADAFICALASYLFDGYPLTDAVQIASLAAAFCVSRQGGAASMVDRQSLEAYLAKIKPSLIR